VDVLSGPVVVLDGADCVILGRQLVEAIRLGYTTRGRPPPRQLLDFADAVSRVARSSARFRTDMQASPSRGHAEPPGEPDPAPSDQEPLLLSTREAARLAGLSKEYMRRCYREGDPRASRGHHGAWFVDAADLDAWISARRKECERARKAA
jgi:Helix-turn-helix domain